MLRRHFVSQALTLGTATITALSLGGCGTLLHSERLNQPHSRDLDWKIVALNGLGLIFFFIPGVIAFVVDFHTGAIYLPPYQGAGKPLPDDDSAQMAQSSLPGSEATAGSTAAVAAEPTSLKQIAVLSGELNLTSIEREVTQQVGKPVWLSDDTSRVTRLEELDQFAEHQHRCRTDQAFGLSPRAFLERWRRHGGAAASTG